MFSLYQVMTGSGVPVAGQARVSLWFSMMLVLLGIPADITGGSENIVNNINHGERQYISMTMHLAHTIPEAVTVS